MGSVTVQDTEGVLILRVAALYQRYADQAKGKRKDVKDMTKPVNAPKGINRTIVKEHGETDMAYSDDTVKPEKKDIQPKDVFTPKPSQVSVRNLAETGKDLDHVLRNDIKRDKGYATVKNLSQYLIETGGGGGTKPVGN